MEVVLKEKFTVVGVLVQGTWEELPTKMRQEWSTFFDRALSIPNRVNEYALDISLSVDNGVYTQLICAEVSEAAQIPNGMVFREIPAQYCIYYRHQGALEQIADSFGKMYQWAKAQGLEALDFKIDHGYTSDGSEDGHDLYLAIIHP